MAKLSPQCVIIPILISLTISMATPLKQSPNEVENWFENLNEAKPKLTKLHFYYHDSRNAKMNLSAVQAVKAPVFSDHPPYFGVLTFTDDPLTMGPEINSKLVGYAQGFYATASLEEVSMLMGFTFAFTAGEFNGSTLAVLGRNTIGNRYRELPIVGGSGVFRLARGIATLQTYFYNFTMGLAILQINVVALHY